MIPLERSLVRVGLALGLLTLTALPAAAESRDGSYGYFRVIEGSATLMQQASGGNTDRQPAEINQPVLPGDRIWVPERSRAEIVLADRNILRLDGGSEVILEQLAASPDRDDPATVLRLEDGNVLLTVTTDSLGDQLPRVDTPNATIYTQHFGTYRITATQGLTELVVRRGKAEVVTDRGSQIVKADEAAFIEGERSVDVESATAYDALERWADKLEGEGRYADNDYIDDDLRYQAAPLARHGSWIQHGGRPYWRPRVEVGWRPYWQGRWAYTPAGLTWVSYEPWGWVPYHYGSWDYLPNYGWAWAPGRRWAPAHVYWYWGPSYAGWCPTGYYTSFYRHRYPYFRSGVYGWAGGSWDHYSHWSFISHDYFRGYRNGYRDGFKDARRDHWDVRRYAVPRDQVRRAGPLERGVITTDTRPLRPDTWNEPRQAIRVLTDQPVARRLQRGDRETGELPDVTPFIQRRPDLPDNVVRTVVPRDGDTGDRGNQAGTRPRVTDGRPGGGTPWEGGVISTDPSDRSRSAGATPRVRVPNEGSVQGTTPNADRPRVGRPQPGQGGGAPRPDSADAGRNERTDRGSTPRVRVPETPQQGGSDTPRARRPEAGSPGGAPRPQADDRNNRQADDDANEGRSRPQARQEEGDRNDEVRSRRPEVGSPGGSPRPSRPESEAPAVRRPDPPRSYDAPRNQDRDREQESRARQREQQEQEMRARTQERERQQQQQREQEVRERARRPERQEEARPSRPERQPERQEEARPAERERGSSQGSESRGSESSGRSGSSRGSRSRPPGE